MRRPQTSSELEHFLHAMSWLRISLGRMAEEVGPLRVVLEQLTAGASHQTKRLARNRFISEEAWAEGLGRAWRAAQDSMA